MSRPQPAASTHPACVATVNASPSTFAALGGNPAPLIPPVPMPALLTLTRIASGKWELAKRVFSCLCSPEVTTEPSTATPRTLPIWREVPATADATPAWLSGIPLTAVLVIGGFTAPNPSPIRR